MGSYTLVLLLCLGVAYATAKPLETTSQSFQETSTAPTPAPTGDSTIPSFQRIPLININAPNPGHPPMGFPLFPHLPQQGGMEPERESRFRIIPINPHERFHYEILNEESGERKPLVDEQTEEPVRIKDEVTDDGDKEKTTDAPMQEDESTVHQPRNDKMEPIMEYHGMPNFEPISLPLPFSLPFMMAPIPIRDASGVPAARLEPMYRMPSFNSAGMREQFGLSRRIPIEDGESDEFMMRRRPMEDSELDEMMRRQPVENSELDEMMPRQPVENSEFEDQNEEQTSEFDPDQQPEVMPEAEGPQEQEPEIPSEQEPEVPSEQEPEIPSEQEPEIPSEQEPEIPTDQEPESVVIPEENPEPEIVEQKNEEPNVEQQEENKPSEESPEMNPPEVPQMYDQYPQQELMQDDGENMVEGYQDMWRGNMDLFRDSPEIPRMLVW